MRSKKLSGYPASIRNTVTMSRHYAGFATVALDDKAWRLAQNRAFPTAMSDFR